MKNNGKSSKPIIAAHSTNTGKNPAKPGNGKNTGAKARGSRVPKGTEMRAQVLERISDGILAFDAQMNHVYVDERAGELLGHEAQDLVGKSFSEVYPESIQAPFADACRRAFETQSVVPFDGYFPSSNAWFEGRVYPSEDGLSVLISDRGLPEQEEILRSLEESEEKFSKAFHSSPIAKLIVRIRDGKVLDTNQKFLKLFKRDPIAGETSIESNIETSEWKEALADILQQQGSVHEHELAIHDASGELQYLLLSAEKIEIEGEACFLITCIDLTERKEAEAEVREISEFPLQNPNPVMRFRQNGELLYANPVSTPLLNSWTQPDGTRTLPQMLQELLPVVVESGSKKETELMHEEKIYSCLLVPVQGADYVNLYFSDITSRKQTQESLQALIHQTTTGITRADLNGRLVFVNQAFCDMLGYSESELIGKAMWELNQPDDIAKNKRLFEKLIGEGESYQLEKRVIRRNGSVLWVTVGTSPLRDTSGRTYSAVSVIIDITRRKRAEESLMDSARRTLYLSALSDLLRPLSDPAQIETEATRVLGMHLKANQVAYADVRADGTATIQNGYSDTAAAMLGEFHISDYIPAQVMPRFRAGRAYVNSGEVNASGNDDALAASNEQATIRAQIVIPLIQDGELVAALFVQHLQRREWRNEEVHLVEETAERMQTAIERSRAEAEQREADRRFRILSDTVPSMVWSTGPDGSIRYLNQYWHNYTGLTMEETIANWAKLALHPDDYERYTALWKRALKLMPDEYAEEARYRRFDGEYRWFQTRAIPARDEHGNVTAWYGVTTDIHDRMEQQAELVKVINNTPFMLTRCSRDLRYQFVSRIYAEMIGRTPEELAGKPIVEIMGEEGLKTILPYIEQVLQGKRVEYETEVPFAGIGSPTLHVIYAPDYDEQGNVIGWFASITDVTARKAAEKEKQQLLEQEKLLRAEAEKSKADAERASTKAEQELSERKLAEAALGVWTDTPLPQESRPVWLKYGMAIAGTAAALLLRGILSPLLGDNLPLVTLYGAVAFSVWYGGVGPALLSILLGYFGAMWFFGQPHYSVTFGAENLTALIVYLLNSAIIVYLGYTMRRAQYHAHESSRVAVERQRQAEFRLLMQKHAEDALRESERKFSLIYHKLPFVAALSKLEDGALVDVNEQFERVFGYSKEEAIGKTSLELGINPDAETRQRMLNELQQRGSAHNIEMELETRSAGKRIFLSNIDTVTLEGEKYILNTIQDITERRLMEQQLRGSEEKYRRIVETANEGIWEIDANTRTTFVNPRMAEMLGHTVEEMLASTPFDFMLSGDSEVGEERLERAKRGIPGRSSEFRYRRKDGSILWTLASSSPQLDEQGNFLGSIALIMDITERKESERALAEYARQQAALYQFSDQLQRVDSLAEIYDAALDTIINALHCDRASILLADEKGIMHFIAWRGLSEKYRQVTDGHSPWAINAKDPKPVYYNDVESSDISEELKSVILGEGIQALAFIPLVSNGKLIGKFMTYFNAPHPFSESEIDFSLTIARQLTFGVDRQHAEQNLRISEDRLRLAVAAANIGIWDIDLRRRERAWSKEGKAIYGIAENDYLDFERQLELTHPDDRMSVNEMVTEFRDKGTIKQLNLEHRIIRPDGALRWVEVRGEAVYEQEPLPVRLIGTIIDITERKRAENALRQSEERFAQFMQYLPGLAWIKDIEGHYVFANATAEEAFAVPREQLYGKTDMDVFPPDVAAQFKKNDEQALMERKGVQVVETLPQKDGFVHYSLVTKFPIPGPDGNIEMIGGTAFDITERKQAENRLALLAEISELTRRFEDPIELMASVAQAVGRHFQVKRCLFNEIDLDHDLEIVHRDYHNDIESVEGRHKITDYSSITTAEMMAGKTIVNHDSKTDPRTAPDYERSYLPTSERTYVAVPLMRDDRWVASLWISDDTPRQWTKEEVSLLETIAERTWTATEKLRIDAALRESQQRLSLTYSHAAIGLVETAPDARILECNDAFSHIAGYPKEELLGRSFLDITYQEDAQDERVFYQQLMDKQIPFYRMEKRYVKQDGSFTWIELVRSVVLDGNGEPRFGIGAVFDITERKQREEALRARTEEVETLMEVSPIGILVAHDPECKHITGNPAAYALLGYPSDSDDNLSKSGPEPMKPFHRVFRDGVELAVDDLPMQKSARFGIEIEEETLELRFEDGSQKYVYIFAKPLFDPQGRTRGTVAVMLDITERRRNEEALTAARERAEETASRIARLQQVTAALSGSITPAQVAEIVVRQGVPALGAEAGTMMELSLDSQRLMIRYSSTKVQLIERFRNSPLTLKTPATDAVRSGEVIWIESREQYLEHYPHLAEQIKRWGYQTAISVPLQYKGHTIGVLNMSFDAVKPYNREDEEFALTLARQAAQALERARAEESLRASEERYRAIINQTTVGIVRKDGDGKILFVNQAFGEMLGYASSELIDMSMWQLTHPDDVAKNRELYDRMMTDGLPFRIEKRLLHRDGSIIWALVSVSPLLDAEGKPQSAVSVYSDITLRKYAESELQRLNTDLEDRVRLRTAQLQAANESLLESEATARLIIESMPDGIVIINKQGQVVYCNSQVEMLFGYKPTEVLGQSVTKLIPERYQPMLGVERELFGQRKDETQFPTDVLVSPISSRTTWDRMITIRDTTEQRLAQEAIRKSEEKLRSLFEVLPVGISFLDAQGNITEMNSTLTQILGLSKVEISAGKFRPRRYVRADGSPMAPDEFASVRARDEQRVVNNVETGIVKENGQVIWTSVSAAPVDVADVDVVVATIDITERKKVEDELHRSRERLRILSRRLVEVQEEERHAIARELHDRVGQNLAALNLNLNILRSQLSAEALQVIGTRLSDSVALVNQILGITRNVMADLRSDVLDEYGLESAVREYADQFMQRTGIQVVSDKSSTAIPRLDSGIEMTLLRIAQEALTNVARHARANRATISISADEEAVHMSIQDDGIGILSWQKANQPGSHGLRIIRERAEAFGGSVQIHSTYKKGTSIEVKIPLSGSSYTNPRERRS